MIDQMSGGRFDMGFGRGASPIELRIFGCDPAFISEVGPVLGAHVGPGLLGVGSGRTDLVA